METTLKFWAVVRDGRRKWVVKYDPRFEIKDGERFAFEVNADEYKKKMIKKDVAAAEAMAGKQADLLGEGGPRG